MPWCHWKKNGMQRGSTGSLPFQIILSVSENICFRYNRFQRIILGMVRYSHMYWNLGKMQTCMSVCCLLDKEISHQPSAPKQSLLQWSTHICCMEPTGRSGKYFNVEDFSLPCSQKSYYLKFRRENMFILACFWKMLGPLTFSWQHGKQLSQIWDEGDHCGHNILRIRKKHWESWSFLYT